MQIDLRVAFINGQTADVDAVFANFNAVWSSMTAPYM